MTDVARRQFLARGAAGATGVALSGALASPALGHGKDKSSPDLSEILDLIAKLTRDFADALPKAEDWAKEPAAIVIFIRQVLIPTIEDLLAAINSVLESAFGSEALKNALESLKTFWEGQKVWWEAVAESFATDSGDTDNDSGDTGSGNGSSNTSPGLPSAR